MSVDFGHLGLREVSPARKLLIAVTSLAALVGSLFALTPVGGESFHWFLCLPVIGLFLAGVAALLVPLPAQLFARAVQWSNLGLGFVLTILGSGRERNGGLFLALGCGSALLAMGRQGLVEGERRAGFVPVAFRSSLLLLLVLALADAQSFGLFGAARFDQDTAFGGGLLVAAFLLGCGFLLLMRLSLAGLVVNVLTCVGVLVGGIACSKGRHHELPMVVGVLAGVHLLVALPTIASIVRGKTLLELGPRLRGLGATVAIVGLMAGSLTLWMVRT